jgi:hypothetical protein
MLRTLLLTLSLLLPSCGQSRPAGPPTTNTTSTALPTLAQRTTFLNQYVTFRRGYQTLDFNIAFLNNNGGTPPGPTEYDIRLIATVPESELQSWIPSGVTASPTPPDTSWLKTVPTTLNLSGVTEWYITPGKGIGLDRANKIVVYRAFAH